MAGATKLYAQGRTDTDPRTLLMASDATAMVTGAEYEVTGGDSVKDI